MIPVILLSFLPLAAAWFGLRRAMTISAIVFFTALSAGILSLALAAVAQSILPQVEFNMTQDRLLLNALRTSLTEEGSRFTIMALLFAALPLFKNHEADESMNAAAGMIAGLAFAAVETASLAAASPLAGPVRLISAVFLHAACGIRGALAASAVITRKFSRVSNLVLAVALHTVYNLMTPRGGLFTIIAILLAVTSFASGLRFMNGQKNSGASGP
ncbi:MAG: hypothetical protein LBK66_13705 [Spirochaetaceae bacterium]|nr:hypothetical protein [Spirochaetaceae bacterium]